MVAMLVATLYGCAQVTPASSAPEIRGLVFNNLSRTDLMDVRLKVKPTNELVACSRIPMGTECSTTFPLRRYQGNPVEVFWKQGDRRFRSGVYVVPLPSDAPGDIPLTVFVDIGNEGRFGARIEP